MQYTIKKVSISDKRADGSILTTKNGNPFYKVGIQVAEHGDQWINGLVFEAKPIWKEGDKVDLEIKDREFNGVTKKEFTFASKPSGSKMQSEAILVKLQVLENKIDELIAYSKPHDDY